MNLMMFVSAISAAIILVFVALLIAKLISPRSFNEQKEEPYECGMLSQGETWKQFNIGYYIFAIVFLMFDVGIMFLFPWAMSLSSIGKSAVIGASFFMLMLVLGLAYAWKKGDLEWD
ncbi:MAG: NADH-quinone oxidoreductase subunit A [Bacteroidales bacterium]|jgi:NADH-quinone oxidoreductase subunit A|nr:NADH-quinone oxidoreductase subunit A [Bacteroidales bacterium]